MLTDIINQIQQERNQDRHMSKKTGTNQIHDFTRIPGHRKVGPNTVFGRVSAFAPVLQPTTVPEPAPAPAPEPRREVVIPEPVSEPAPIETVVQQQQPTRLSKAAMKRKQKEEELAKKREAQAKAQAEPQAEPPAEPQAEPQAPTPEPIEIESTVSE